ncbi:MAG: HEAT repeat domain-containing protein [Planctomycetota bacterium]
MIVPLLLLIACPLQTHDDIERWLRELTSDDEEVAEAAEAYLDEVRPERMVPFREVLFGMLRRDEASFEAAYLLSNFPESEYSALLDGYARLDAGGREHLGEYLLWNAMPSDLAAPVSPEAVRAFEAALVAGDSGVRAFAAQWIDGAGHRFPNASSVLSAGLQDSDPGVRARCATALGNRIAEEPSLGPLLESALTDSDHAVRERAVLALANAPGVLSDAVVESLIEISHTGDDDARHEALERMGRPDADPRLRLRLLQGAESPDLEERARSIEGLFHASGGALPFEAESALTDWLLNGPSRDRSLALDVAERIGPAAVPLLQLGLTSSDLRIRLDCALRMFHTGASSEEAAFALASVLPDEVSYCTPGLAVNRLQRLGANAIPALETLMSRASEWKVGSRLVSVLSSLTEEERAAEMLAEIVRSCTEPHVVESACEALESFEHVDADLVQILLERLRVATEKRAIPIVSLLGELGSQARAAAPVLIALVEGLPRNDPKGEFPDPLTLNWVTCGVLGRLGDPAAIEILQSLAEDEAAHIEVRRSAIRSWMVLVPDGDTTVWDRFQDAERVDLLCAMLEGITLRPDIPLDVEELVDLATRYESSKLGFDVYPILIDRPAKGRRALIRLLEQGPFEDGLSDGFAWAVERLHPPAKEILPRLWHVLFIPPVITEDEEEQTMRRPEPDAFVLQAIQVYRQEIQCQQAELRSRSVAVAESLFEHVFGNPEHTDRCEILDVDAELLARTIADLAGDRFLEPWLLLIEHGIKDCRLDAFAIAGINRSGAREARAIRARIEFLCRHPECCDVGETVAALGELGSLAREAAPILIGRLERWGSFGLPINEIVQAIGSTLQGTGQIPAVFERYAARLEPEERLERLILEIATKRIRGEAIDLPRARLEGFDEEEREMIRRALRGGR